jgi:hypothetical protein
MKALFLFGMALGLCSCGALREYDFVGAVETPYGEFTYRTPPKIEEPGK